MEKKRIYLKDLNEQFELIQLITDDRITRKNVNRIHDYLTAIEATCRICRNLLIQYLEQHNEI